MMEYALNEAGVRICATAAEKAVAYHCPICTGIVVPRQGECNRWHFAHKTSCEDRWSYDMSEWHLAWQEKYPEEARERVVTYRGVKHRADVLLGDIIIEFQHSPITASEFSERNSFYTNAGYRVIWVFDVVQLYEDGQIRGSDEENSKFYWTHPSRVIASVVPQSSKNVAIILELASGAEEGGEPWLVKVEWAKPSENGDCAEYSQFYIDDNFEVSIDSQEEITKALLNKWERFDAFLREHQPYASKCSRVKGHPRSWYICEKTNDWHNDACKECQYNLVSEYRKSNSYRKGGLFYYCRYPNIVAEPDQYGMIQRFSVRL
jgi:hypothetical protein